MVDILTNLGVSPNKLNGTYFQGDTSRAVLLVSHKNMCPYGHTETAPTLKNSFFSCLSCHSIIHIAQHCDFFNIFIYFFK